MKLLLSTLYLYIFSFLQVQAAVTSCNCVVFRLDDIQDYWLSNNQQTLINTFRNQSLPLTIGIIANQFGDDTSLVNTIKNGLSDSKFPLEIADHGYNHEDFTTFSYANQLTLLKNAITKIKTALPAVTHINSFIPPYNTWNANTLTALGNVNITYMSSQVELDPPPYPYTGQSLYRFPEGAQTDLEDTNLDYSIGVSANYTMAQVRAQIASYGYAVIMLHPMEYSNVVNGQYPDDASLNQTQYKALLDLIKMVKASYTITTLNKVPAVAAAFAASGSASTTSATTTGSTTGAAASTTTTTAKATTATTTSSSTTGVATTTGTTTGAGVNLNNCSCVVFRLDDIQDYWLNTVQTTLINTFRNKTLPLTIGVIANYFGTDSTIVNAVNNGLGDTNWNGLEVADHGFNHEDFTTFTYAQQLSLLQQATSKIKSVLPKAVLKSFIPPYNTFNNNTITALKNTGYSYMSSQVGTDLAPYPLSGQTFYRFPEGAETSVETTLIRGIPAATTMSQIRSQIGNYGFSVVMMHPQEFANVQNGNYISTLNTAQYNQLLSLIDMVKSANLRIVNLDKVNY